MFIFFRLAKSTIKLFFMSTRQLFKTKQFWMKILQEYFYRRKSQIAAVFQGWRITAVSSAIVYETIILIDVYSLKLQWGGRQSKKTYITKMIFVRKYMITSAQWYLVIIGPLLLGSKVFMCSRLIVNLAWIIAIKTTYNIQFFSVLPKIKLCRRFKNE